MGRKIKVRARVLKAQVALLFVWMKVASRCVDYSQKKQRNTKERMILYYLSRPRQQNEAIIVIEG